MTYKPSEHGGLKEDGTPDKRTNPEHGFGGDSDRASKLGAEGGKTQPEEVYKPSEHGGVQQHPRQERRVATIRCLWLTFS